MTTRVDDLYRVQEREKKGVIDTLKSDISLDNSKHVIVGRYGRYRIDDKRIIGRGSLSVVYSGLSLLNGKKIAVKKINCIKLNTLESISVERELKIINKLIDLGNPDIHIVAFHDIIRTNTDIFIVMEFCSCMTLTSLLIKPMKQRYSKYYFKQLVSGLVSLKRLNIVHRDIKPANVLITDNYKTLKICDFGFSELVDDIVVDNVIRGSASYMAPEMINPRSRSMDHDKEDMFLSDVWSAGMILHEMVYGHHPFCGLKDIKAIRRSYNNLNIIYEPSLDLDKSGVCLLRSMLSPDIFKRINIDEVIEDEWFLDTTEFDRITLSDVFHEMSNRSNVPISRSLPKQSDIDRYMRDIYYKDTSSNSVSINSVNSTHSLPSDRFNMNRISGDFTDNSPILKPSKSDIIMNNGTFDNIIRRHNDIYQKITDDRSAIDRSDKIYLFDDIQPKLEDSFTLDDTRIHDDFSFDHYIFQME